MPMLRRNSAAAPGQATSTGTSSSARQSPRASQSAARAVGAVAHAASNPVAASPVRSAASRRSAPPKRRRLPDTSSSSARGGSSEALGVNWQAHAARRSRLPDGRGGKCSATQSMSGPVERHEQRSARRRAATLENAQREPAGRSLHGEAQAGGRRLALGLQRAEQRDESGARFGGGSQPLQLGIGGTVKPREQHPAGAGAQHLLGGPERVAPAGRAHHGEVREIDARRSKRRRV